MQTTPSFKFEKLLWKKGLNLIAGLDEVGRGAFAGPLVAAAVILPQNFKVNGIKDSKLLSSKKREMLSEYILKNSAFYVISEVNINFINKYGIGNANHKAFMNCINKLNKFDHILVDGYKIRGFDNSKQTGIVNGDFVSVSIAAASIIAKVHRDNIMTKLDKKFPQYNFLENKGYGTKFHRDALVRYGLTNIHRTSFKLQKFLD